MARKTLDPATSKQFFATRYKQGGRTVYQLALTPAQIAAIVAKPTEMSSSFGNRKVQPKHATDFARYFEARSDWVAPGIILRAPNIFDFELNPTAIDVQFGALSYPERQTSQIHILDGQHRILGFHEAIDHIDDAIDKAHSAVASARRVQEGVNDARARLKALEDIRDRLNTERLSVEIQVVDNIVAWRQMFFDIADNQLGITASVKARFDSRKVVNRALVQVLEHPLLDGLVDGDQARLKITSDCLLTANHVTEILRVLMLGFNGRFGRRFEAETKDAEVIERGNRFFSLLPEAFPLLGAIQQREISPATIRRSNLIASPLFLRILAGAYHVFKTEKGWSADDVRAYFAELAPHLELPQHENSIFVKHGPEGIFNAELNGLSGRRQDSEKLMKLIVDWGVLRPDYVTAAPEQAPAAEVDPDEGIDFAPSHSTKVLEVQERNAIDEIAQESKSRAKTRSTVGAK